MTASEDLVYDEFRHNLPRYLVVAILRDGNPICVRAIRPDDGDRLRDHFRALSPTSAYYRFFGYRRELSCEEMERFTRLDFDVHVAIVATCWDGTEEQILADIRYVVQDDDEGQAELAISVVDSHHGRGIGALMLRQLALIAHRRGIRRLVADVMSENRRALEFFVARGFRPYRSPQSGVVRLSFPLSELRYQRVRLRAVSPEQLNRRAYELFIARGRTHGDDLRDWLAAERELLFGISDYGRGGQAGLPGDSSAQA